MCIRDRDVYNAGSTASSEEKDRRGESDLGAFDAVTRATAVSYTHLDVYKRQSLHSSWSVEKPAMR